MIRVETMDLESKFTLGAVILERCLFKNNMSKDIN
jgi:hypothetical protein